MRMKMDNSRFLFAVAAGSLVLFSLASSGGRWIGPCDCRSGDPLFEMKVQFQSQVADHIVRITIVGNKTKDVETVFLAFGEARAAVLSRSETWTYQAQKSPLKPPNSPFTLVRAGTISGPATIVISDK